MRILSFVSFLLVGAAYGSPVAQPSCLTLETKDLCHFPFNYKGVIYDKCTYVETINNKPWCATVPEINITREGKVLFKSQFGDCDLESNCEVEVEVEDCSEDTCPCPRHYKPVCAEDGEVYDNLCLYECAKKKAACKNKREFPELVECNSSSQLGYISKFDSKQNDECQGKPCGEMCRLGVCDGHGFCVSPLENPCEQHGCHGKSCGEDCLLGDILGSCDIKGNCDSDTRKAVESCNQQAWNSREECSEPCSSPRCDGLSKLMKYYLDLSVDPCNDFFAFSCNPNTRGTKAPISPRNGISMEKLIKFPPKGFEYVKKFFLSCTKVNTAFSTEEVFAICFGKGKCDKKELKDYGNIFAQFLDYTKQFINKTKLPAVTPNWEQVTENLFGGQGWIWWDFAAAGLKDYFLLTAFQKIETENQDQETENSYDIFRSNVFFAPMIDTVLEHGGDYFIPTVHIVPMSIPDTLRTGNESYLRKYRNIMKQILISFGADPLTVDNDVKKILNMELEVGKINPKKWFSTKYGFKETVTIEQLHNLVPSVEWKDYIEEAFSHNKNFKIQRGHKIKIPSESLMTEMATLIETLSTRDQANLLIWRMFIQFANDFMHTGSEEDDIQKSHFNKIGSGSTRSDNCIAQIETFFPKAYNDMYIVHYLDKSTKINIKSLFEKLRKGFEKVIHENDWISKRTKIRAQEKLAATKINVGELSPNTPEFQELKEKMSTTDYIGNILAIGNYIWHTLSKNIKEEKELLPVEVTSNNAYYARFYNEIEILTGLINHQFVREALSPGLPRALLFGGFVSTTLGHELVHGFDDQGKQYDKDGLRLNWWQKKDDDIYSMKTVCISKQYANFNITYNGEMYQIPKKCPQGENIADNGGVKAAYQSYLKLPAQEKKCMPDLPFTSDQLFWLGHAFAWCADSGTSDYESLLSSYPSSSGHYPAPWRVNAVLANQPEFAANFNCPVGSPMNPQPEDRCIIW